MMCDILCALKVLVTAKSIVVIVVIIESPKLSI